MMHGGVTPGGAMTCHGMRCDLIGVMGYEVMRRPNCIAALCDVDDVQDRVEVGVDELVTEENRLHQVYRAS